MRRRQRVSKFHVRQEEVWEQIILTLTSEQKRERNERIMPNYVASYLREHRACVMKSLNTVNWNHLLLNDFASFCSNWGVDHDSRWRVLSNSCQFMFYLVVIKSLKIFKIFKLENLSAKHFKSNWVMIDPFYQIVECFEWIVY